MDKKMVRIYDTISKKIVDVEVSDEVYTQYNRTQWGIENNNKSFYKHEIQFSALKCGKDNEFENFKEFIKEKYTEEEAVHKMLVAKLYDCLNFLSEKDHKLIEMLFFDRMTERECAEILCTTQQNVHKKKMRILCRLYKLLKSE